jgi:(p)ppGpp synthase/HD superfamily hydrolase
MALINAISIAYIAHGNQTDRAGQPFIGHPLRVMANAASMCYSEVMLEAAVLHDIMEDCGWSKQDLRDNFINEETINLVDILTRRKKESYMDYIHRVMFNKDAMNLKVLDILDNSNPLRNRDDEDITRVLDKYIPALKEMGFDEIAESVESEILKG